MGIALPKWIVESSNNIWVLGLYGIIFGGALPALVVCHFVKWLRFGIYLPCIRDAGGLGTGRRLRTACMPAVQPCSSKT